MFISSTTSLVDSLAAIVAAVLDAAGPAHSIVKLAQGPFAPSPVSDPTGFTEATFTGYASKTVPAWAAPYLVNGIVAETIPTTILEWRPTGTTTTNLITGYWIVGGNGDYIGGEAFSSPIPMGAPTDALNLVPRWQIPLSTWSGTVVS